MTVFADISAALDGHLNAMSLPTAWENNEYTPTIGELYLRPTLLPASTEPSSYESSDEHSGVYQIDVIAPMGGGKGQALTQADLIADQFKSRQTITYNGVNVYLQSTSRLRSARDDGWYIVPISVTYRAYTTPR